MKTKSKLERVLAAGQFAITAEISPPQDASCEIIKRKIELIKGYIDAFNVPDGQAAVVAMASWGVCLAGMQQGLDAIAHVTCRDRNRIALQMDILALAAFGLNNILCLSGDPVSFGNHPTAKSVFDLDCIQLIRMVKRLRDEKKFDNGQPLVGVEPRLFIGAVANPSAEHLEAEVNRLKDKVTAGAEFIQTQPVYNVEKFAKWMNLVRQMGLHEQTKILVGVTPVTSLAAARFMKTKIPGIDIPDRILERLRNVRNREEAIEEGIGLAVETIKQLKQIPGVAGVHLMTLQREEIIPRICREAGLYPRS